MLERQSIASMLAIVFAICTGCSHPGQRLLEARIEKDGQLVLRTHFGVPDTWAPDAAWQQLNGRAFEPVGAATFESNDSGQVQLKGNVRVALVHAGTPFAAVDVEQLQLVGDLAGPATWRLAPGEVVRTAKALKIQKE